MRTLRRRAADHAQIAIGAFAVAVQVHNRTPRARALRDGSARVVFPRQFWTVQMPPPIEIDRILHVCWICRPQCVLEVVPLSTIVSQRHALWGPSPSNPVQGLELVRIARPRSSPTSGSPCGSLKGNLRCGCAACGGRLRGPIFGQAPRRSLPRWSSTWKKDERSGRSDSV